MQELKTVKINNDEFNELRKLNFEAFRAAQDAEIEVQRLKFDVLSKQKAARDYLYKLSESYTDIDVTANYDLDRDSISLVPKKS